MVINRDGFRLWLEFSLPDDGGFVDIKHGNISEVVSKSLPELDVAMIGSVLGQWANKTRSCVSLLTVGLLNLLLKLFDPFDPPHAAE